MWSLRVFNLIRALRKAPFDQELNFGTLIRFLAKLLRCECFSFFFSFLLHRFRYWMRAKTLKCSVFKWERCCLPRLVVISASFCVLYRLKAFVVAFVCFYYMFWLLLNFFARNLRYDGRESGLNYGKYRILRL